jgi:hypothetical protein
MVMLPPVAAVIAKFFRAEKSRFFLMIRMRKPSASTLGYVIRILMIIKLAISILRVFL